MAAAALDVPARREEHSTARSRCSWTRERRAGLYARDVALPPTKGRRRSQNKSEQGHINKQLARFSSMGSLTRLAWRTRNSVRIVYNDKWRSESGSYPTPATSENSRVTAKTSHPQSRESTHTATARVAHDRQPVERRTTAIRYGCCVLSHLFAALSPLAVWWDRAT